MSSFAHQRKLVLGVKLARSLAEETSAGSLVKMMENKRESGINVVRDLIELLDLTGVVLISKTNFKK